MKRGSPRRRPAIHITLGRAARLHHLVTVLAEGPRTREQILSTLGMGLRTFYRELELLRRVGVKVRLVGKDYTLLTSASEAEGRLPFPDPQLSFAEMAELARCDSDAGRRLADLLASVVAGGSAPAGPKKRGTSGPRKADAPKPPASSRRRRPADPG